MDIRVIVISIQCMRDLVFKTRSLYFSCLNNKIHVSVALYRHNRLAPQEHTKNVLLLDTRVFDELFGLELLDSTSYDP